MINPTDFLNIMDGGKKQRTLTRLGVIGSVSGKSCTITFDGETQPSQKYYKCLESYLPVQGDTVLMIYVSGTYVILGKIVR